MTAFLGKSGLLVSNGWRVGKSGSLESRMLDARTIAKMWAELLL